MMVLEFWSVIKNGKYVLEEKEKMKCEFKLLSSLEKVFFDRFTDLPEHTSGSMLKNEIYSFQLAAWGEDDNCWLQKLECQIKIESALEQYIQIKQIDYVPSIIPGYVGVMDEDYITHEPGLFPDPLHSIKDGKIVLSNKQARSFWVTVEPNGKVVGTYPITLKVLNEKEELLAETSFTLEIIDAELPELDICNTGWFHGDCLAEIHNVEVLSEEYFKILEKYLAVYVKFGHNMILTPIFTPPLDTVVGGERPTNQLVEVTLNNGNYSFGFKQLKRWVNLCRQHGIKFFEICHLFTQWGAYHAPKIMATVDGEYKKLFGWETEALSEEYKTFLNVFLPELVSFLEQEGVMDNCYFHVSDEPMEWHEEQYRAAKEILLSHIDDSKLIDALSNYSFYEKGIVTKPIVSSDHIHTFMEHGVENLWTYYCMGQGKDVSNRFMAMPSYRNRILGYQLYKYDIKGFLQWGFNFWFKQFSTGLLNPYLDTTAGGGFPAGDSFVVYPLDEEREVVCSLRLYVFHEAMQDLRALKLLEELTDRDTVLEMLKDVEGFTCYPRNSEYIIQLREMVNRKIFHSN